VQIAHVNVAGAYPAHRGKGVFAECSTPTRLLLPTRFTSFASPQCRNGFFQDYNPVCLQSAKNQQMCAGNTPSCTALSRAGHLHRGGPGVKSFCKKIGADFRFGSCWLKPHDSTGRQAHYEKNAGAASRRVRSNQGHLFRTPRAFENVGISVRFPQAVLFMAGSPGRQWPAKQASPQAKAQTPYADCQDI
jgi:hypothetical protein